MMTSDALLDHRNVLHLRQGGDIKRLEVGDDLFHLLLPLIVEFVPVFVVVSRALHEQGHAAADLLGIGHRDRRDVDVAVDDPMVDTQGRRDHENT